MGSTADELDAAVRGGRIRRRELGVYLGGKGFSSSRLSKALGPAVSKWGALAKIEFLSEASPDETEEGYVPSYEGVAKMLRRGQRPKFTFGPRLAILKGLSEPPEYLPLLVDVTAHDYAPNCKAKVAVFPQGMGASPHSNEVQAFWQPGDRPMVDLNAGESAPVELLVVNCSTAWRHSWHEGDRDMIPNYFIRTPEARSGMKEDWYEPRSIVNVLILTVYSASFFCYLPFLFLRKKLTQVEVAPIVGYTSKGPPWSGKGLYSTNR